MRRGFWVLLVLLAMASAAQGAPWTQPGANAARTGLIDDVGPKTNDTAFEVTLPGVVVDSPIIVDGGAILVTRPEEDLAPWLTEAAAWRVDLATAEVTRLFDVDDLVGLALRGDELLVLYPTGVRAHALADGQVRWDTSIEAALAGPLREADDAVGVVLACHDLAVLKGTILVACDDDGVDDRGRILAAALDGATGEIMWLTREAPGSREGVAVELREVATSDSFDVRRVRLAATPTQVFVYALESAQVSVDRPPPPADLVSASSTVRRYTLWGLDAATGDIMWARNDTLSTPLPVDQGPLKANRGAVTGGRPAVGDNAVFLRLDRLEALNPASGDTIWATDVGQADASSAAGTTAAGLAGDVLFATSSQTLYRVDALTGALQWQNTFRPGSPELFSAAAPLMLADGIIYAEVFRGDRSGHGVFAFDMENGRELWRKDLYATLGSNSSTTSIGAVAEGVFVLGARDGKVTVVGSTLAALQPPPVAREAWPGPGAAVTVDLSETGRGVYGPATLYRADWGDGTDTGWTPNALFTHAYETPGEHVGRFWMRNDANQTASFTVAYHVGAEPPVELNAVQQAFAPENQDLTFGVLGIALAVTGGAIGIARARRKRSRLTDELLAIDAAYRDNRANPPACEAALAERKAHVQAMLREGRLDDGQASILRVHVDELHRELRVWLLDDRFQFLPHGMVLALRNMLADGRITAWERQHVLRALEEDDVLTKAQKKKVRALVDEWFQRDVGNA